MGDITAGYTWASGATVTPTKLNDAINLATIDANAVTTAKIADSAITAAKLAASCINGQVEKTSFADADEVLLYDSSGAVLKKATFLTASNAILPAGMVMPFAVNSAPSGWLSCDGSAVSRSTYARLFSAISTTYGAGNGSTTFNIPDLRGIFIRGTGAQTISGTTYTGTHAAKERDALQGHRHSLTNGTSIWRNGGGTAITSGGVSGAFDVTVGDPTTDGTNGTPRTAAETRPANISLLYCIKF